jgi:hypothetical protein
MASILDRYGIKEVADVTFYSINADGSRGAPALYLDTLKVSTIEQTAETADARGGKGNPKLVTWDYGKEITVTIEDALFSSKSMAIMFGNGKVNTSKSAVTRTVVVRLDKDGKLPNYFVADIYDATAGSARSKVYMGSDTAAPAGMVKFADSKLKLKSLTSEDGYTIQPSGEGDAFDIKDWQNGMTTALAITGTNARTLVGEKVFVTYEVQANKKEIVISGDSFPGTYYVVGDTYARSDVDGRDQFFQFIIEKAKVTSENTITLEAEGDPSVFSMNLTVLRPESGEMMKLVQYDLVNEAVSAE